MRTITVRMISTARGSPDGVRVRTYARGETHRLPEALARTFIAEGWAERPRPHAKRGAPARKALPRAPENKRRRGS